MTTILSMPTNTPSFHLPDLWRMSVARYHEMIAAGLLTEDDRIELLEGILVQKMTVNPPHAYATETVREAFARILPPGYFVSSQQPVTTKNSEPEPDIFVVRGQRRDFVQRHPSPEEVAIIVEVADATLQQDQTWKKRIYAHAGIPIYWIVNLPDRQIEVYTEPSGPSTNPTYRHLVTCQEEDEIAVRLGNEKIAVFLTRDLLP